VPSVVHQKSPRTFCPQAPTGPQMLRQIPECCSTPRILALWFYIASWCQLQLNAVMLRHGPVYVQTVRVTIWKQPFHATLWLNGCMRDFLQIVSRSELGPLRTNLVWQLLDLVLKRRSKISPRRAAAPRMGPCTPSHDCSSPKQHHHHVFCSKLIRVTHTLSYFMLDNAAHVRTGSKRRGSYRLGRRLTCSEGRRRALATRYSPLKEPCPPISGYWLDRMSQP
jgi:hypothetical protein